jgi:hypothetical protein
VDRIDQFVAAFNDKNLDGLGACLAEDASAQVLGSPFPVEEGRDAICATSLPYLLESDLQARRVDHPTIAVVLLRDGCLDVAIEMDDGIATLRYLTMPHRSDELRTVASDLALRVAE